MEEKKISSLRKNPQKNSKTRTKQLLDQYEEQLRKDNKQSTNVDIFKNIESFKERDLRKMAQVKDKINSSKTTTEYLQKKLDAETEKYDKQVETLKSRGLSQNEIHELVKDKEARIQKFKSEIDDEMKRQDRLKTKASKQIQKNWDKDYKAEDGLLISSTAKKESVDTRKNTTKSALEDTKRRQKELVERYNQETDERKKEKLKKSIEENRLLQSRQEHRYNTLSQQSEALGKKIQHKKDTINAPANYVKAKAKPATDAAKKAAGKVYNSKPFTPVKQSVRTVGKAANKIKGGYSTAKNAVSNGLNGAKQACKRALKNAVKSLLKVLGQIINAIVTFLVSNPIGWFIDVVLILLILYIVLSVQGVGKATDNYKNIGVEIQKEKPTLEQSIAFEYRAWVNTYKDEEEGEPRCFYDDYRQVITSDRVAPIAYVFRDDPVYRKILSDMNYENILAGTANDNKDLQRINNEVMEKYYDENKVVDKYTLRQLFLDKIEYDFSYLYREYTDWEKTKVPGYMKKEDLQGYIDTSKATADAADESMPYTQRITVWWYDIVDKYGWVEKKEYNPETQKWETVMEKNPQTGKEEPVKEWKPIGKQKKYRSESKDVTLYKYRNVKKGSEVWYPSPSQYPMISENVNKGMENNRPTSRAPLPGVAAKDANWEKIYYGGNGIVTKRLKHWKLKKYDEVVDLLIYHYHPETKDEKYKGDSFKLTFPSSIDSSDTTTITIDKKKLYPMYYATKSGDINHDAYFSEKWIDHWEKQLEYEQMLFKHYAGAIDFTLAEGKFLISPFLSIEDASKHITQRFNEDLTGVNGGGNHEALDIAVPYKTDINAVIGGTVIDVYDSTPENTSNICYLAPTSSGCHGARGNQVVIESKLVDSSGQEHTLKNVYYHIYNGSATVQVGDTVEAGQIIAQEGHNGLSSGPHLHWELWVDGKKADAEPYTQWTAVEEKPSK